jgi:N-acetylneuraminate synthase
MIIINKLSNFIILDTDSINAAINKINLNESKVLFVVNDSGLLIGSLTDGDIRRYLISNHTINIDDCVYGIINKNVLSLSLNANPTEIYKSFSNGIKAIPLVQNNRLMAIAINSEITLIFENKIISENSPAFIIAEIGNNHNGDYDAAIKLIDLAIDAGADCVKFQMRDLETLYKSRGIADNADLGVEYTLDLLSKFQLSDRELFKAFDYCRSKGVPPLCTPWDIKSVEKLERYGLSGFKISSADFTNHHLISALASIGKPLICSTGMSTEFEIIKTIDFMISKAVNFSLLHCNSTYPAPFKDINLKYLNRLKALSHGRLIGYSGHERGVAVPIAAVAMGAKIIEKHFTIDKNLEGNDHKVSLLPTEFSEMVSLIRNVEAAMGSEAERDITQGEMINRHNLAKSLMINCNLNIGETIERSMIEIKSPGQGLQPMYIEKLVGRKSVRKFNKNDFFYNSDIADEIITSRNYRFNRPFGIPIRFHDYSKLSEKSNFNLVEFHLSYKDLELKPQKYIERNNKLEFLVHSPELFKNDHILNLASSNKEYRHKSISELARVCELTEELNKLFPKVKVPKIIVNVGGYTEINFIEKNKLSEMYLLVRDSLEKLEKYNVEFLIQTMPPFPWHFGGQSFHNLFVDPNEIEAFCINTNHKICLDISHSMMACNYFKWNLHDFINTIGDYVGHLHISDAKGVDGEGIQIGNGDVDFILLGDVLDKRCKNVSFIPEIWQGHINEGAGFWAAFDYLEGKI